VVRKEVGRIVIGDTHVDDQDSSLKSGRLVKQGEEERTDEKVESLG